MNALNKSIALALVALSPLTFAAQKTATMPVTAAVVEACASLTATPLAFGNVGLGQSREVGANITVECAAGVTTAEVGIDDGTNALSGARRMRAGATSNFLPYVIVKTNNTPWGLVGTANSQRLTFTTASPQTVTVVGRLTNVAAPVGSYTDTLTVTLNF